MHDEQTIQRFIERRVQGASYDRIAGELGVAKTTLIDWSRKHQHRIHNLRAIERERLQEEFLSSHETHVRALGDQLHKVEAELAKRNLADLSTTRLFLLLENLRSRIRREVGPMTFLSDVDSVPADEYVEQVQQWTP